MSRYEVRSAKERSQDPIEQPRTLNREVLAVVLGVVVYLAVIAAGVWLW